MKTPPDRSGITFEVGAQLQARDRHKNWYSATIEKIDYDKERVLIHYRQWSRRHDEWFQWNSPYLRPLERVGLRRQGLSQPRDSPLFVPGTKVLACWTDCRFYPAKILRVNKDDSYTVRFFDGVVRTVKPTKVKPFQKKSRSEKATVGSEGWEEGESEEDDEMDEEEEEEGGEREEDVDEEEEERKEEEEEEEAAAEGEEGKRGDGEMKGEEEPSSSHPPPKKKADEDRGSQNPPTTADSAHPPLPNPAHIDRDVLLERQAHLPTTHKFSREPLYRVIKNQPPPILSIELDHNPFKCPSPGCTKSFRKASLLHYHIKYYHSEQQLEERTVQQEAHRRKRSSSEGGGFTVERKSDVLQSGGGQQQEEFGSEAAEMKKEASSRDKSHGHERKERKNFLRVKLKKKKKKKKRSQSVLGSSDDEISERPPITLKLPVELPPAHTHVDEGSDWSTLTAESGEDTSSCWPVAMETEECEMVRCVCEVDEENDFMIQCESCLCWQHGTCMGLYEDNVPHNYVCYYCRHSSGWRRAQRYASEPELLTSGHMFGLSCVKENYSEINASKISHTSSLLAHTHRLHQLLSGLQLKISLLHSPSHPELQLWRLPWRWEEGQRWATGPGGEAAVSYVSSEHCYQKPGALWEKAEGGDKERPAVKQEPEQQEIKLEDVDVKPPSAAAVAATPGEHTHLAMAGEGRQRLTATECQLNLLEHVEALHHHISSRMDLIERELDVLESWLDHSGELEPPDPLSRLPQLKQRIRRLLCDLCTLQRLSLHR